MPSKSALAIISKAEEWLERPLTYDEGLSVEEMNLNMYSQAIINYIDGFIRKKAPKDFQLLYFPIMNGVMRGAFRRRDLIYIKGRFKAVYERLHALTGDGMSQAELEAVTFLAEDCTDKEVDAAIAVARNRGVHHVKYVRAVIEGNRRAATKSAKPEFKKFVPAEYEKHKKVDVPRVDIIRDNWRKTLASAERKMELAKVELNAKKNLTNRDKSDGINPRD